MIKKLLIAILLVSFVISPSYGAYRKAKGYNSKPVGPVELDYSSPLVRGLVGCWLMNEGGGLKVVDLANKNNGAMAGGVFGVKGKSNGVLLDGTNGRIPMGTSSYNPTTKPFSVVAGVIPNTINAGALYLFNINDGAGTRTHTVMANATDGGSLQIQKIFTGGSGSLAARRLNVFTTAGVYVQIVATNNGGPLRTDCHIYSNAIEKTTEGVGTTDGSGTETAATGAWQISGRSSDTLFRWNGAINYLYYYNRALSPSEIQSLYTNPYQIFVAPKRRTISQVVSGAVNNALQRAKAFLID